MLLLNLNLVNNYFEISDIIKIIFCPFTIMKGLWAFFFNFNAMYLLISLCYFTTKGQIAGTQHYRNRQIRHDMTSKAGLSVLCVPVCTATTPHHSILLWHFSFHHYRYRRQPRLLHSGRHGLHTGSGLQSLSSKGYNRF